MKQIAILSEDRDLHALLVQRTLSADPGVESHFVPIDRISDCLSIAWSNWSEAGFSPTIETAEGVRLAPGDLDLVWWRRLNPPQVIPPDIERPEHIRVITNDSHAAVMGLFVNEFHGTWVNDVSATRNAENKLVQLRAAAAAGLAVPRTLVSNDPVAIRSFCAALDHRVIVKAVRGTTGCHIFTRAVTAEHLASDACLRLSPAIYQEMIPGSQHLRVHCFGEEIYAAAIESEDLDWRESLEVPFTIVELGSEVKRMLRASLDLLGLRMGIVDLKLTMSGAPMWLEVNPQGQYLFTEGLSGLDLTSRIAEFLIKEAHAPPHRRSR